MPRFTDADMLREATFTETDLTRATFDGANLTGATFDRVDLTDAVFRGCDLIRVRIVASEIDDVVISGHNGQTGRVVIDDVDVTSFVEAELDRRHPERIQLRTMRTADDFRAMWQTVEECWSGADERVADLSEAARQERVDDEWSVTETRRHLVFAVDTWLSRMVLGTDMPFHHLGLPPTDYPAQASKDLGIDIDARPSYADAAALHADRMTRMRDLLADLTDTDLEQIRTAAPAPEWDVESLPVGECLRTVMEEHCAHYRFAMRDLAVLTARREPPASS